MLNMADTCLKIKLRENEKLDMRLMSENKIE